MFQVRIYYLRKKQIKIKFGYFLYFFFEALVTKVWVLYMRSSTVK